MPRWSNQFRTAQLVATVKTYPQGYHKGNTTGLDGVDADLATGNIKSGITLFGVAGSASVLDVSDADAAVGDVLNPRTFYSVTGPRKTGTMPTVAITNVNDNYPAGYHAGDAGGLDAIDTDLASANIKSGATIFGKAGAATVQDIADADLTVAEAPTGKKFYSVTGGVKTGTGTKTLVPASENVNAGYYAATTLSAVDGDLAVGNIKSGVTIFGKLGTYLSTLSEDLVASAATTETATSPVNGYGAYISIAANSDYDLATKTSTFAANSMAAAIGYLCGRAQNASILKLRLYMAGVQVAESAYLSTVTVNTIVVGTRALSGSKICKIAAHNDHASLARYLRISGDESAAATAAGIGVGSIKAT